MLIQNKKSLWQVVTFLILILFALSASAKEKSSADKKIAVVNGSVITNKVFDREMTRVQNRFIKTGKTPDDSQLLTIKKQILNSLINQELLYQESQKKGIKIEDTAVDEQISQLKKRFSCEADFQKELSRMNTSEIDLKSQFKRGMAVEQFIDDQIAQKITISRKEVKMYYDSHPDNFKKPEQVKASHILIKVDPQADESQKKEARKKLDAIKQKLKKGEDFSTLAREFSQCPSSSRGGDLSYFGREQMVKPFSDAAFALKTGEVSDIIETRFGYHLIKVTDRKSETKISYQDAKEKVEQYLKQKKIFKEVNQYLEKVKRKAKIETFF